VSKQTIPLREAGNPEHLNCSRGHIYELRNTDPDFKKLVPVFYLGTKPMVFVEDLDTYKLAKRKRALAGQRPKIGRPRKQSLPPAAE
jgi:hypothetical protein